MVLPYAPVPFGDSHSVGRAGRRVPAQPRCRVRIFARLSQPPCHAPCRAVTPRPPAPDRVTTHRHGATPSPGGDLASGTFPTHPGSAQPASCCAHCPGVLYTFHDVRAAFGLGPTAARLLTREPDFPAPYVISSRCYRWDGAEVLAYREGLRADHTRELGALTSGGDTTAPRDAERPA